MSMSRAARKVSTRRTCTARQGADVGLMGRGIGAEPGYEDLQRPRRFPGGLVAWGGLCSAEVIQEPLRGPGQRGQAGRTEDRPPVAVHVEQHLLGRVDAVRGGHWRGFRLAGAGRPGRSW